MGIGRYVFSTRLGQENAMYDRLDQYVSEAAGLRYVSFNFSQARKYYIKKVHYSVCMLGSHIQFWDLQFSRERSIAIGIDHQLRL